MDRGAAIQEVDEEFSGVTGNFEAIDGQLGIRSMVGGRIEQRFRDGHRSLRCFSEMGGIYRSAHPHYTEPVVTER